MTSNRRQFRSIRVRIAAIFIVLSSGVTPAAASTDAYPGSAVPPTSPRFQ